MLRSATLVVLRRILVKRRSYTQPLPCSLFTRYFAAYSLASTRQFLWFRLLFPSVVALATSFVVWRGLQSPAVQAPPLLRFILLFGIAVNFIQMGLLCMFLLVAAFYRMRWRQAPLGISLGFAIAATGALAGYWLRSEFGTRAIIIATYIPPVAYLVGVVIWLLTFLKPEPEPSWVSIVNIE